MKRTVPLLAFLVIFLFTVPARADLLSGVPGEISWDFNGSIQTAMFSDADNLSVDIGPFDITSAGSDLITITFVDGFAVTQFSTLEFDFVTSPLYFDFAPSAIPGIALAPGGGTEGGCCVDGQPVTSTNAGFTPNQYVAANSISFVPNTVPTPLPAPEPPSITLLICALTGLILIRRIYQNHFVVEMKL